MATKIKASNIETGAITADKLHTTAITDKLGFTPVTPSELSTAVAGVDVSSQLAALVDSAPSTLDTLNELAAALGDDPNFATTVTSALGNKANSADVYTQSQVDTLLGGKANLTKSSTEPSNPADGDLWFDTNGQVLKIYNGTEAAFLKVAAATPTLSSVVGDIVKETSGNLTLNGTNFLFPNNLIVTFTIGGTEYTATATTSDNSTATVAIPSSVYGSTIGNAINITVTNDDGLRSSSVSKTLQGRPVVLTSVSGSIYNGTATTLTLTGTGFNVSPLTVYFDGTGYTGTVVNDTTVTIAVPSAVYNGAAGNTVSIEVKNADDVYATNSVDKTIVALPSGGTITSSGGYRYHTFTSSGTFTNTVSNLSAEYLIVAGGGSGGNAEDHGGAGAGGGGAGGMIASSASMGTGNYAITIGGGGAAQYNHSNGYSGSNSVIQSVVTANGGGYGGLNTGGSGGSGGGGGENYGGWPGGSGTAGQGNSGGQSTGSSGGGGGGKAGAGQNGAGYGGAGGAGAQWSNGTYYAGGGGGGGTSGNVGGAGGIGGGGSGTSYNNVGGGNGSSNTGGGGGGTGPGDGNVSGQGGSGIVIIRYAL